MFSARTLSQKKKGLLRGFELSEKAWEEALQNHKRRMKQVQPAIRSQERPWGCDHRMPSARHPTAPRPAPPKRPATTKGRTPRAAQQPDATEPPPPPFCLQSLPESDRKQCLKMVELLQKLTPEESIQIAEEVFQMAEEQRLLSGYTGVFSDMPAGANPAAAVETGGLGVDRGSC